MLVMLAIELARLLETTLGGKGACKTLARTEHAVAEAVDFSQRRPCMRLDLAPARRTIEGANADLGPRIDLEQCVAGADGLRQAFATRVYELARSAVPE